MLKASLTYDNGTIIIKGLAHIPFAVLDPRIDSLRAPAMQYSNIINYLRESAIEFSDYVLDLVPSPDMKAANLSLRDYQQKALDRWTKVGMKGCIVLPTGAGKTIIGIKSIEKVNSASLVIVPTLELMSQWTDFLSKHFTNITIGNLGGGLDDIQPITVATYDSAYIRAASLGDKFSLVIFDEVHHLAAPGYRSIAEQLAAPYRLGLTATIEREDKLHLDFPKLVGGGVVFEVDASVLAKDKHLAQYKIERRQVEMTAEEKEQYQKNFGVYQLSLKKLGIRMNYHGSFRRLIMMSTKNRLAREALLARNKAMEIALNSEAKMEALREILAQNRGVKTIIFTQHNSLVYDISDKFLLPAITHRTEKEERKDILAGFKEGRYLAIATSKVLDEGVDVPDAKLGIIVSGTGSGREFIQRLGRLLRPKKDISDTYYEQAKLIEIISSNTREAGTSAKRKKALMRINRKGKMRDEANESYY
ncbi:MAG: DEAD/DEAH box helicase family protein [Nitrososphaeraceae archaeon]